MSDIEALPLRAGSFDAVIAAATLHYALDLFGALAEAARVLRRGGLLIIADSPVYADAVARDQAWQRTLAHYTAFGAPHLAARYHGLTRAELDGAGSVPVRHREPRLHLGARRLARLAPPRASPTGAARLEAMTIYARPIQRAID